MWKEISIFCDFDGTITNKDTVDVVVDACIGHRTRKEYDQKILDGTLSLKEAAEICFTGVRMSFEDGMERVLQEVVVDDTFFHFVE
jgi:2-hydroxy-3-keto-5-methylthiopentenyl-1-phosphate phosphatase